ncbi:hypothetical protein F183_A33470 [Bryobacterales bacterium F-183]|nr:hypothetical protein F183_A33470 [Bryobacterales bacterium F-183]
MSLLGVHLTMLIGPPLPLPPPAHPRLLDALVSVEVTQSDSQSSGVQAVFRAPRSIANVIDLPVVADPMLRAGNRMIVMVTAGIVPQVLFDGIITLIEFKPGSGGDDATVAVTGLDLSVLMDRKEVNREFTAQPDNVAALTILSAYAPYGVMPIVVPPKSLDAPVPTDRIPQQRGTDLSHLQEMAKRHAYVFFVEPGRVPGVNKGYWGPPPRLSIPQPALTVDMGSESNVKSIGFQHDEAAAARVEALVQDRKTNRSMPVRTFVSLRPPLALYPGLSNPTLAGRKLNTPKGGQTQPQAQEQAQADTEASMDVVKADGELDVARYGGFLKARALVGLRGVGFRYDGLYYVSSVTSNIARHSFTQKFSLAREGTGSTVPVVRI